MQFAISFENCLGWNGKTYAYRLPGIDSSGGAAFGRPRCRWKDSIDMTLTESGWGMVVNGNGSG